MKQTQGRRLIAALRRRAMTYGDMQDMKISTSPQKRVLESLRDDEQVIKSKDARGLVRWRVVKRLR